MKGLSLSVFIAPEGKLKGLHKLERLTARQLKRIVIATSLRRDTVGLSLYRLAFERLEQKIGPENLYKFFGEGSAAFSRPQTRAFNRGGL